MNSAVFIALAAGVDETQMAISSTGYYLAGNIGALIGASVASNILVATLKSGLENALRGVEGGDEVRIFCSAMSVFRAVRLIVCFRR